MQETNDFSFWCKGFGFPPNSESKEKYRQYRISDTNLGIMCLQGKAANLLKTVDTPQRNEELEALYLRIDVLQGKLVKLNSEGSHVD